MYIRAVRRPTVLNVQCILLAPCANERAVGPFELHAVGLVILVYIIVSTVVVAYAPFSLTWSVAGLVAGKAFTFVGASRVLGAIR